MLGQGRNHEGIIDGGAALLHNHSPPNRPRLKATRLLIVRSLNAGLLHEARQIQLAYVLQLVDEDQPTVLPTQVPLVVLALAGEAFNVGVCASEPFEYVC